MIPGPIHGNSGHQSWDNEFGSNPIEIRIRYGITPILTSQIQITAIYEIFQAANLNEIKVLAIALSVICVGILFLYSFLVDLSVLVK
jgi:hypothetical protein